MPRCHLLPLFLFTFGLVQAQEPMPPASQVISAITTARLAVNKNVRGHMMSIAGEGTLSGIVSWTIIFYDDTAAYHGRRVQVQNNRASSAEETGIADGDFVKTSSLTPDEVTEETPALAQAQDYAQKKSLACNHVRLLLQRPSPGAPLLWRVELLENDRSLGFIFTEADGTLCYYSQTGPDGNPLDAEKPGFFTRLGRSLSHLFGG